MCSSSPRSLRRVRFDVRLMQRVPYEGTSRMQTSLRRRHRDRVVRRGLAMMIESDFYATDAGRQHFADQLKSIRYVRSLHSILSPPPTQSLAFPVPCAVRPGDVQLRRPLRLPHLRQLRLQLRPQQEPAVSPGHMTLTLTLPLTLNPNPNQAQAQHPHGYELRGNDVRDSAEGAARLRQGGRGVQVPHVSTALESLYPLNPLLDDDASIVRTGPATASRPTCWSCRRRKSSRNSNPLLRQLLSQTRIRLTCVPFACS